MWRISALVLALLLLAASRAPAVEAGPTIVVDRVDDVPASACTAAANDCSLRGAITKANATPATEDVIHFNVGTGVPSFQPTTALPDITTPVTIEGATGGADRQNIYGASAPDETDGLRLVNHNGSTLSNLVINGWKGEGIEISGGSEHTIVSSLIGTNYLGDVAFPNRAGIAIADSSNNVIGSPGLGNVISGNTFSGIDIYGDSEGNEIASNLIGTNLAQTAALANGNGGIDIQADNNTVGAVTLGNVISGNVGYGIFLAGSGNSVVNNSIGISGSGAAIGNLTGISVRGSGNTVGGAEGLGNTISGNTGNGVSVDSGAHVVSHNSIGTSLDGNSDRGNGGAGVLVYPEAGGTQVLSNVVSGNETGVSLLYEVVNGNVTVSGNTIGANAAHNVAIPNDTYGILVNSSDNTIGGQTPAEGNFIAANGSVGIYVDSPNPNDKASNNSIYNNWIGGTASLPGNSVGVLLTAGSEFNRVGSEERGNTIVKNNAEGVFLLGDANRVNANHIGVEPNGQARPNGADGVRISGNNNDVGDDAGNIIRSNTGAGVFVELPAKSNRITRNEIAANGGGNIDLSPRGPTPNDQDDPDTGANNIQNFAVLTEARQNAEVQGVGPAGGGTTVEGSFNSNPNTDFLLEFFAQADCATAGASQPAERFIGQFEVTTDSGGDVEFSAFVFSINLGEAITSTATHEDGSTSEVSACIESTAPPTPTPSPTPTASPTPGPTEPPTPTPTPTSEPTVTPGTTVTPTPAPTSSPTPGPSLTWGDSDCDGEITTRDNQALLRAVLQQNPLSQTEPCPDLGTAVPASASPRTWGDWDCDAEVTTRDNQALLRKVLQQNPLSQTEPCPDLADGI